MSSLLPVEEGFFSSAPVRYTDVFAIPRPAEEVWGEFVSDTPLEWCRGLSIRWTSARPFAVGTTREAKSLGGAMKLQERYFIWEEGRRQSFYVTAANVPVFSRFAEDYVIEPDGAERCRLTWTFALEPTPLGRFGGPVNGIVFKRLFADTRRHFHAS